MALPKKGLRYIVVDKLRYAWKTTGNDHGIDLYITPVNQPNSLLSARFDYHSKVTREYIMPDGIEARSLKQQISITGYIVRQVILHAIKTGWDPKGDVAVLNLGVMDDKIDIRVEEK
jgi:hypothetical protein